MENTQASELEKLQDALDIYGADRTRWPARVRLQFAPLLSESGAAQRLLAEAAALDRLLSAAPTLDVKRQSALADRIAGLAASEPRTGQVISMPIRAKAQRRNFIEAAALLAASLVLGVMVGTSGVMTPAVTELAAVTGFADSSDALASYDDGEQLSSLLGEDVI